MTTKLFAPLPEGITTSPASAEVEVLQGWRHQQTFEFVKRAREKAARFVFWEGPPTANGRPGIHHVLARTVKDAVCRWQTMNEKRVVRKAGWDTHGLPVEIEVEKKLGINGKIDIEQKIGVAKFNEECRKSVWTYQKEWEELSERTGYWLDYADPYVTYSAEYVESVWSLLARFHQAGLVYRGKKVLPYCGRCGTGLSSHELGQPGVYRDIMDPSLIVRFRLDEEHGGEPVSILAWTTTPWTLPSNVALAVHPEREYILARVPLPVAKGAERTSAGFECVWLAKERASAVLGVLGKDFETVETAKGVELKGKRYRRLFQAVIRAVDTGAWITETSLTRTVVLANYVTVEDGTGVVHQAPCYGVDDWNTATQYHLEALQAVGPEGRFVDPVGPVAVGTFFKDADNALMDDLKRRDLLFKKAHESHSYPHCWRCNTPLFYFAVPAWYIRTTAYKDRMVELNKRIRWVPAEVGEKRFGEWLENNIDWNISRDRYWGTPLPFWVCERDEKHELAIGSVDELRRRAGSLPEGFDNHKPLIDEVTFACDTCGGTMRRTKAVLDCWFDSGAMPYAQYHWPFGDGIAKVRDQFPADFIAEGLDQTRGWFYTLHAIGAFVTTLPEFGSKAEPAYKTCVVNGLVLDKDGVKMSKRLGNVVDPWKAIEEHGADAVRWYLLASGQPWLPKRFDPAGMLEVRRKYFGTLLNSYKFLADYARIDGFDPRDTRIPAPHERTEIDRWLVARTQILLNHVHQCMQAYDLAGACHLLEDFVIDDVSNWYIRRNRRRFWLAETGGDKLSAFATLHAALATASLLSAPFAPFMSEVVWTRLEPERGSVHAAIIPPATADDDSSDWDLVKSMHIVKRVVEMGRALRERLAIKVRQPLRALHVRTPDESALRLLKLEFAHRLILEELNIKQIGSLASDDGHLCTLKAKANFKVLGKRLGGLMKRAAEQIEKLGPDSIALLRVPGSSRELELDGQVVKIGGEDILVQVETNADFELETDGRYVVWFDTELDEELILEGLAREVVNRVNGLRKEAGLAIEDRIRLGLHAGESRELAGALLAHQDLIRTETLAVSFEIDARRHPDGSSSTFDLGEGRQLFVSLVRA